MNRLLALVVAISVAAPALAQDKPVVKPPTAVITLEKGGQITLEFFPADAPKHVENFVKLVRTGFYNGHSFHRVDPDFVVQRWEERRTRFTRDDPAMGTGGPG